MKKLVVLVLLIVLLTMVSAVYADSTHAAAAAQVGAADDQITLQVSASDPYADWNCPLALLPRPKKCIFP